MSIQKEFFMNRIVVITGATSGIGLLSADLFRKDGDTVITLANVGGEDIENFMYCDVSDEENIKKCFEEIKEKYGRVDVLVNNAGYGLNGVLELIPTEKIEKQFAVNVYGVINCTRYALPLMSKGAKIINMSSCMALFPMPYRSMYAASKSAVLTMSFSQRMELKPLGIDVIALCPGNIRTNFTKNKAVVLETNERYGDAPLKAQARLDSPEADKKRMDPIHVAKVVFKVSKKKRTKPFYIISGKMKLLYFVCRLTPKSLLISATGKVTG